MQTDTYCKRCLAAVRNCRTSAGAPLLLDPRVERNGRVWIIGYDQGVPIVAMTTERSLVPAAEALCYRIHVCPDLEL